MRALVLSGGGARGAYQAGAIRFLMGTAELDYDIISGISVGALNGAHVAQYRSGYQRDAAMDLVEMWRSIEGNGSVYKKWFMGRLAALWKTSVYNSQPLEQMVHDHIDQQKILASGKRLSVGAVALETGEYRTWNDVSADILPAVLASSAFPGMLCPVTLDGKTWVDGGLREVSPVTDAIELGASVIDVVINHPLELPEKGSPEHVVDMLPRIFETMTSETTRNDIERVELYNELRVHNTMPDKRHIHLNVLEPSEVVIQNALDFDPTKIEDNIKMGYYEASQQTWV